MLCRLYLLVKLYGGVQVAEYSSSLTPRQRKGILRDFKIGKLQLLICSDAMARGMDIQDVSYVISYDVPNYVRSYIHRVGRTARAGNKGKLCSRSCEMWDLNGRSISNILWHCYLVAHVRRYSDDSGPRDGGKTCSVAASTCIKSFEMNGMQDFVV